MPAVKPHPRTAFAKPGSHQSVVVTPEAAMHQHSAKKCRIGWTPLQILMKVQALNGHL